MLTHKKNTLYQMMKYTNCINFNKALNYALVSA